MAGPRLTLSQFVAQLRRALQRPKMLLGIAVGGAALMFALLPGSGTHAMWNAQTTVAAGGVTAATIKVSEVPGPALDYRFHAGNTANTGGVTVTNSSDVATSYSMSLAVTAGGSPQLAAAVTATIWQVSAVAQCTASATPVELLASGPLSTIAGPYTGTIGAGATTAVCIRTTMNVNAATGVASASTLGYSLNTTVTAGSWNSTATTGGTLSFLDDIAPNPVTGLTEQNVANRPLLSWAATSDNVGVTGYNVYRDGGTQPIATVAGTAFTDTTALAGITYSYTVSAQDAAGNISPKSAPVSLDRTPPSRPTLTAVQSAGNTTVKLTFTATDNVAVTGYTIYRDGSLVSTQTGTSYSDTAPGTHTYTVVARDFVGNVSPSSSPVTVTNALSPTSDYQLVSKATGQCVTTDASSADLSQATCSGSAGQQWQLNMIGSSAVITSALDTGNTVPMVWDSVTTKGTQQVAMDAPWNWAWFLWGYGYAGWMPTTMQWTPTPQTDGYYTFDSNGQCLTAGSGTALTVTTCVAGTASQEFAIK